MYEYEHENVKANLERLAKIDEACEKEILEKYLQAEINMYNTAKSFVQMYEAKKQVQRKPTLHKKIFGHSRQRQKESYFTARSRKRRLRLLKRSLLRKLKDEQRAKKGLQ
jgi:hypothetical protein